MEKYKFTFSISLTILNHLGRNLYRSFVTVIGEAISNSWDAEADNVEINYNPENKYMYIRDDGFGMNKEDIQDKFLNIGYSKRDQFGQISHSKNRPHIGRKGIGKLALLSCAERVVIWSKTLSTDWVGVVIDNKNIDLQINKGSTVKNCELFVPDWDKYKNLCVGEKGTIIIFENLKEEKTHTEDYLRKVIALYFRFSLIDDKFKISLNNNEVTITDLQELACNTQFLWVINNYGNDSFLNTMSKLKSTINIDLDIKEIRGFIASVRKPSHRNIFGAKERVGLDLFVNGRMREINILRDIPSSQVPEEYLFGQINIDNLDSNDDIDRFTSSREGVQNDDMVYKQYLMKIKKLVLSIMDSWDDLREINNEDGDPENTKRDTSKNKKAKSLIREVQGDYNNIPIPPDSFTKEFNHSAAFNASSYVECYIAENILRKYIIDKNILPTSCLNIDNKNLDCLTRIENEKDKINNRCAFCKGTYRRQELLDSRKKLSIAYEFRNNEDDILLYLDYIDLVKIINDSFLKNEDKFYKPLRNSVMHTSSLTLQAKRKLTTVFDNIIATVKDIFK